MSENIEVVLESILKKLDPSFEYSISGNLKEDFNMDSLDVISFLFEVEADTGIKIPEEDIDKHELMILGNIKGYIEKRA